MPLLIVFIVLSAVALGWSTQTHTRSDLLANHAEDTSLGGSMRVYGKYVASYARNHPGFIGSAPNALLNLPEWYRHPFGLSNHIEAGTSYVYIAVERSRDLTQVFPNEVYASKVGIGGRTRRNTGFTTDPRELAHHLRKVSSQQWSEQLSDLRISDLRAPTPATTSRCRSLLRLDAH